MTKPPPPPIQPAERPFRFSPRVTRPDAIVYSYQYDGLDRLTQVDRYDGDTSTEFRRYVYDHLGNRLAEYRDGKPFASYRYDAANRLIEASVPQGMRRYTYDPSGNLLDDGAHAFAYDAA